jgi:hypothetical protein
MLLKVQQAGSQRNVRDIIPLGRTVTGLSIYRQHDVWHKQMTKLNTTPFVFQHYHFYARDRWPAAARHNGAFRVKRLEPFKLRSH